MSVLSATGLVKRYGNREVVREISLSLEQGKVVGLLGPNGAGKTTTFYMLVGIIKPDQGRVELGDKDITDLPLYERARLGLSYLPQESSIFKRLTVLENLLIILEQIKNRPDNPKERALELLRDLSIERLAGQKAMHLSGGERRRLEIARALILNPTYMLLDEPFAGIDPIAVDEIQKIVVSLKERNIGVLISDHNVRETLNICDTAHLVYEGRILLEGTPEKIVADKKAKQIYLGEQFRL